MTRSGEVDVSVCVLTRVCVCVCVVALVWCLQAVNRTLRLRGGHEKESEREREGEW